MFNHTKKISYVSSDIADSVQLTLTHHTPHSFIIFTTVTY